MPNAAHKLLSITAAFRENRLMHVRFLLGPAGSGKTWRCLAEVRAALADQPEGEPLILLAPKQATFQLERQLLAAGPPGGFARLQILSFERLARFVLEQAAVVPPQSLSEEGRVMVLRALLMRHADELQLFRRSARRAGFARQLSQLLAEFQQHQVGPATLRDWSGRADVPSELKAKLGDLAVLLAAYRDWLQAHDLQDGSHLLDLAAARLNPRAKNPLQLVIGRLWLDGFAEMTPQELDLLLGILPHCREATLAFCLDAPGAEAAGSGGSWLSIWSAVGRLYQQCRERASRLPDTEVTIEVLDRDAGHTRFAARPALRQLEAAWARNFPPAAPGQTEPPAGIRLVLCPDAEAEATHAARAILQHVRAGGRYRDCAVIVRQLAGYHKALARSFRRHAIPFFLDQRESIAHHPLAELTRSALRTVAFDWPHEDWFSALKAGFSPVAETQIDRLENESLARGWRGKKWREPIQISEQPALAEWAESLRQVIWPPFARLARQLTVNQSRPTGTQLAAAMRQLWRALQVQDTLEHWSTAAVSEAAMHRTVLEQMNAWLDNVALAFAGEPVALRDWLPILDAGLAGLTIGVIPPALDQVLVGAIDRARNPELKLTVVLGLNEGVFPATPAPPTILTEADRAELSERSCLLGPDLRERLARERFYGYIACTRSSEQLLLACSRHDVTGQALNPSPFIGQVQRQFPALVAEVFTPEASWSQAETAGELAPALLGAWERDPAPTAGGPGWSDLLAIPELGDWVRRLKALREPEPTEALAPALARRLYGPTLRSSVSRLEEFAACPFRYFVRSGLQANERKLFELDARERGNFQHDILKIFHERLESAHQRWRELTPLAAREQIAAIAQELMPEYRDGLFRESAKTRFAARAMTGALQDFVEVVVTWLRRQNEFDPTLAEVAFDSKPGSRLPAWDLPLGPDLPGLKLSLHGRIDRVDIWRDPAGETALAVIIDYKSGGKKLDPLLVANGVQLQLLAYLNVLRHWPKPDLWPGLRRIEPAGVFYVNLRGAFDSGGSRSEVLEGAAQDRQLAYRHNGKFDAARLPQLDRLGAADQFNYRRNKDGSLRQGSTEALTGAELLGLLEGVETQLIAMGRRIYGGAAAVDPYRKGTTTPCDYCDYASVCRIDPWTHQYRRLRAPAE